MRLVPVCPTGFEAVVLTNGSDDFDVIGNAVDDVFDVNNALSGSEQSITIKFGKDHSIWVTPKCSEDVFNVQSSITVEGATGINIFYKNIKLGSTVLSYSVKHFFCTEVVI